MKKFLIFALSAVMLLSLAGCGLFGNKTPSEGGTETKTPKMVTLDANNKLKVELGLKKERFLPGEEIKLSFEISGLSDENDNMTAWLAMMPSGSSVGWQGKYSHARLRLGGYGRKSPHFHCAG